MWGVYVSGVGRLLDGDCSWTFVDTTGLRQIRPCSTVYLFFRIPLPCTVTLTSRGMSKRLLKSHTCPFLLAIQRLARQILLLNEHIVHLIRLILWLIHTCIPFIITAVEVRLHP